MKTLTEGFSRQIYSLCREGYLSLPRLLPRRCGCCRTYLRLLPSHNSSPISPKPKSSHPNPKSSSPFHSLLLFFFLHISQAHRCRLRTTVPAAVSSQARMLHTGHSLTGSAAGCCPPQVVPLTSPNPRPSHGRRQPGLPDVVPAASSRGSAPALNPPPSPAVNHFCCPGS